MFESDIEFGRGITRRGLVKGSVALAAMGVAAGAAGTVARASETTAYVPGTYTGSAKGISSDVTVTVTIDDAGAIADVAVDSSGETAGIGADAADELSSQLMEAGTSQIDGVSGATVTSKAAMSAMDAALEAAAAGAATDAEAASEPDATGHAPLAEGDVPLPSFLDAPEAIPADQISQALEADVVVVGLGRAGVAAARSATEQGLSVIAIERSSTVNDYSNSFSFFNCQMARDMGVEDIDTTELVNELMTQMGHRPDFRVLKRWADNAGEAMEWYGNGCADIVWVKQGESAPEDEGQPRGQVSSYGAPYEYGRDHEKVFQGTLGLRPRGVFAQANLDTALACGNVTAVFDTRALQLVKDGERVSGVIAQSVADGSYLQANATKAVVLATGDYLRNDEMLAYYMPWIYYQRDKFSFTYPCVDLNAEFTDQGDGHRMGYWAGGHIEDGPHAPMAHGDLGALGVDAFLQLNANGERYINEDLTNDHFGAAIIRQPHNYIYQIFDAEFPNQLDAMQAGLGTKHSMTQEAIDAIGESVTAQGQTIEELVANLGVTDEVAATMVAQIERYNELATAGHDDDFGKSAERMFPLVNPPFYAIKYDVASYEEGQNKLRCLVGLSGLSSDQYGRVLNDDLDPIEGLFAVGNVQGSRFLGDYPTTIAGMSNSIAVTYGYLVGRYIAENL